MLSGLKRQDDVIEEVCTIVAAIGRALFHALRNPLGALPGSNRQFQFHKRGQHFIGLHNVTLAAVGAIMVSIVRSISGYKPPFPIPKTR